MRSAGWLMAAVLVLAGCGVGDGLRVEGPVTVGTPPPSARPSTRIAEIAPSGLNLDGVRQVLLGDDKVEAEIQRLIQTCSACVRLGPSADIVGSGRNQQVALVSARDQGPFAAYLVGELNSPPPRVLWSYEGDNVKVSIGDGRSLVVESVVFGLNDRACCPTGRKVGRYEWSGTRIVLKDETFVPGSGG
jgi:hypothetical protein